MGVPFGNGLFGRCEKGRQVFSRSRSYRVRHEEPTWVARSSTSGLNPASFGASAAAMPADPAPITTTSRSVIDASTVAGDAEPAEDAVRRSTSREKAGAPLGGERGSLADTGDCVTPNGEVGDPRLGSVGLHDPCRAGNRRVREATRAYVRPIAAPSRRSAACHLRTCSNSGPPRSCPCLRLDTARGPVMTRRRLERRSRTE
jgi:hypothetical protein